MHVVRTQPPPRAGGGVGGGGRATLAARGRGGGGWGGAGRVGGGVAAPLWSAPRPVAAGPREVHRPAAPGGGGRCPRPPRSSARRAGGGGGRGRGRGKKGGRREGLGGLTGRAAPVTAHLGQGVSNTTCTLRRRRHAATSSRIASHPPSVGVALRAGVLRGAAAVLPGLAAPRTTRHTPVGVEASTSAAAARASLGGARGLTPRRRHRTEPSWVIPTPMAPRSPRRRRPTLRPGAPGAGARRPRAAGRLPRLGGLGGGPGPRGAPAGGRPWRSARPPSQWRRGDRQRVKGKGKVLGRSPNSSVSVIPTCPSQHPFRLAGVTGTLAPRTLRSDPTGIRTEHL